MYTLHVRFRRSPAVAFLGLLLYLYPLAAQEIDMNAANAAEEYHWGVKAFHNGLYGESIRAFERALAFTPDNLAMREWLGNAYFKSGYEDTALSIWDAVLSTGNGTPLLRSKVETVRARRGLGGELSEDVRYVTAYSIIGEQPDFTFFSRPASLFPRDDGSFFLTSFAGNQVLRFSANGALKSKILGGIHGLDHPFDVLEIPGKYLFISEFLGNSIVRTNTTGTDVFRFGEKGTSEGKLIGPQFMAADEKGYIYVAESGNRRISKFDYDGNFVLSFGRYSKDFDGLKSPTGICVHAGKVYVADGLDKVINVFDQSGNYLRTFGAGELSGPEGLSVYSDRELLIADGTKVVSYDIETEQFSLVSDLDGEGMRITKAVTDVNGDIVVADFTGNTVTMLTDVANIYTGLFVQIQRILADDFPNVFLELTVEDRMGNAYLGLDESNFVLSELRGRVAKDSFLRPVESERPFVAFLVDGSTGVDGFPEATMTAASQVFDGITAKEGDVSLITTGEQPSKEGTQALGARRFAAGAAASAADAAGLHSDLSRFSLGLRLAVTEVLAWPGQPAVVFMTDGELGNQSFDDYSLEVSASFLKNNNVAFYCIYSGPDTAYADELEYLCEVSGGSSAYLYGKKGIAPLLDELVTRRAGRYFFSYESVRNTEFGERYLAVEAEVFHFKRSGRDESGYFAPRE
jgi:DNA-binding beta-propeller fold protein YncE